MNMASNMASNVQRSAANAPGNPARRSMCCQKILSHHTLLNMESEVGMRADAVELRCQTKCSLFD